jgi:Domain of unknown function (DUF6458)
MAIVMGVLRMSPSRRAVGVVSKYNQCRVAELRLTPELGTRRAADPCCYQIRWLQFGRVGLGTSIFLIALGAILRYAVTVTISGIELQTVGLILMIVGIIGLVISVFVLFQRDGRADYDERTRRY